MLELEHIQKAFDGVPVLKDLSLQVEDGEIVSILGPSGCGKTTLLNIILGIVDADQGEIRYSGARGSPFPTTGICRPPDTDPAPDCVRPRTE